jgi:rhomboid protease GluP
VCPKYQVFSLVTLLCLIDFSVYLACLIIGGVESSSLLAVPNETLILMGAKVPWAMRYDHEWWRFITPVFLHKNLVHLLENLAALLIVGSVLEFDLGTLRFFVVFMLTSIGGTTISALLSNNISCGGSNPIFGLAGLYFGCLILNWLFLKQNPERKWQILFFFVIVLAAGVVTAIELAFIDGIGLMGAYLTGILVGLWILPPMQYPANSGHDRLNI